MTAPDRLPPLADAEMDDAQRAVVEKIAAGPRGGLKGPFIPLLRSPDLADRIQNVGAYLRFGGPLDQRLKELAILLTARWGNCEYEWQAHRALARKAGLDVAKIDAIGEGKRPETLSEDEALVHDTVTELLATGTLTDASYARARDAFGEAGVIDLVTLPGYYFMLALVLNVARTPLSDVEKGPFAASDGFPWKDF